MPLGPWILSETPRVADSTGARRVFHFASVLLALARVASLCNEPVGVRLSIRSATMGVAASAPDDVLERASGWLKKKEVLCLRALSPRGRDVAKRAISRKAILDVREVKFVHVEPWE